MRHRSTKQCRNHRKAAFTLVEILAAMAVLVVLMGVLFTFLSAAQTAWSLAETNSRIYENAQVALDVITRDLQSAIASNLTGREIPFYRNPDLDSADWADDWDKRRAMAFVAAVEPNTEAKSLLCEIRYELYTGPLAAHREQRYWLRRARTCDRTTSDPPTDNPSWDFYGKTPADVTAPQWYITGNNTEKVIPGVEAFSVQVFPAIGGTGTINRLPQAVHVTLKLFDPKLVDAPVLVRNRTRRTFTKTIFLGGRG